MTLKELSQLYYLGREIEMDKKRLEELEAKALPGAQSITGAPHAAGLISDQVGRYAAEIADLRGIIEAKHKPSMSKTVWNGISPGSRTALSGRFSPTDL